MTTDYIKTIPCELQSGHKWNPPLAGEDALGNPILLVTCRNCGKVRSMSEEKPVDLP